MQLAQKLHKNCNQPTLWYVAMKNDAPQVYLLMLPHLITDKSTTNHAYCNDWTNLSIIWDMFIGSFQNIPYGIITKTYHMIPSGNLT